MFRYMLCIINNVFTEIRNRGKTMKDIRLSLNEDDLFTPLPDGKESLIFVLQSCCVFCDWNQMIHWVNMTS